MSYIDPANDGIDVTAFPYDIEALHNCLAKHAVVIDIGVGTQLVVAIMASGATRTFTCVTNGEQLPAFIKSFEATTTVARIRIFFDG